MANAPFDEYLAYTRKLNDVSAASSTLQWDQETYMPDGGADGRAEQIATLEGIAHEMLTASRYSELLGTLDSNSKSGALEAWEGAAIRESVREHSRAKKLPSEFVHEMAKLQSLAQQAWKGAREAKEFARFEPYLRKLVDLKRREAEYYGYKENPYDAMLDLFEPGMTTSQLAPLFERLKSGTLRLLEQVRNNPNRPDDAPITQHFDVDKQLAAAKEIVALLGFDFKNGRVDLSAHPFCTSFGVSDVRLTTRIYEDNIESCLFGLIHEAGHGMYEQGFDSRFARTPLANGISMGIHESQSLFWENMIARSEVFWQWGLPILAKYFPEQLSGVTPNAFFRAINIMEPTFIRVSADELTYNMHIILRFEIEEALMNGRLDVADIPALWNAKMEEYLGIVPADDAQGCLQDVHWSFGGIGYFPCYSLGKLYAAMLYEQALVELPDLLSSIQRGEFAELLTWLRSHVHQWGKSKTAAELIMDVCGKPLTEEPFLAHIERKIAAVYPSKS